MNWIKKNKNYVIIILGILFLYKSVQSCNRDTSLSIKEKKFITEFTIQKTKSDSILDTKNKIIDSLDAQILDRNMLIKDLSNELKIAGIRASEAQRRADAVQSTAEKIKANTTISIVNKNDTLQ